MARRDSKTIANELYEAKRRIRKLEETYRDTLLGEIHDTQTDMVMRTLSYMPVPMLEKIVRMIDQLTENDTRMREQA